MEMDIFETLILVMHVLAALSIIGLVLIQQGKGADMGSGFGAGASSTVFGSGGAGNFLSRATTWVAIAFFLTSFALAYFAKEKSVAARDLGIPAVIQQVPEQVELPSLEEQSGSEVPNIEAVDSDIPDN
jgi:preprotein translocase subunit SecG